MPSAPFPEYPDAARLFARNGVINADLPLSRLTRLAASLPEVTGDLTVALHFGHDEAGRRRLTGSVQGEIPQLCQRCLQIVSVVLECSLDLLILNTEAELQALPDAEAVATDVIVAADDDALDVLAIIEDEVMLSLPLVVLHEEDSCNQFLNDLNTGEKESDAGSAGQSQNPFAVLAALKKDSNTNTDDGH